MKFNYLASLSHFVPEIIICILMVGLLLIDSTYEEDDSKKPLFFNFTFASLVVAFIICFLSLGNPALNIFSNSLTIDSFSTLAKIVMILGTLGSVYLCKESSDIGDNVKSEYAILAVGVLIGGMLLSSANNFLIMYIGIETLSILSYVMASLNKTNDHSSEAGLKYSIYGGVASGLMLFGMSHVYGVLGTIQFTEIFSGISLLSESQIYILIPSFVLFFAGIGYKIACVPFHMWAPDVYEGSPIPVTTFFSIVPKIAGIAILLRVTLVFFSVEGILSITWIGLLSVIAALTMTVGNVTAIGQRSVKRMLAYSSISHAGMMMMGVLVMDEVGAKAILFYGITYLFMTLVAFYITNFVQNTYGNDYFDRFDGLISRYPLMSICLIISMFSLAGLPPFGGFVAKFNILTAIVSKGYFALAFIAALNSVVSLYYYMRLVRATVFNKTESNESIQGFCFKNQGIVLALTVPIVTLGLFWSKIIQLAGSAKIFIQ